MFRLQPDTEWSAPPAEAALPESRPRTTLDLAIAKLRTALQERSGYVVVTAESAAAAEALFATVEPRLTTFRTVRASGSSLDPEAVVRSLWRDGEPPFPARLAMRTLLDEARAASQPIVVAITDADVADPTKLERVRLTLEGAPDAGEIVRIALLGGPALIELLRQPQSRAIALRIGASVAVPTASSDLPTAVIVPLKDVPRRAPALLIGGLAVAAVAAAVAWTLRQPVETAPPVLPAPTVASRESAPLHPAPPVPAPVRPAAVVDEPEPHAAAPVPTKEPEPPAPEPEPTPSPAPTPAPPAPVASLAGEPEAAAAPARGAALQVGAFIRAESAEALRRKLAPQFPSVYVSPMARGGSTFHRVRVGGFRRTHDLEVAAAMLRTTGYTPLRVRE